MKQFRINSANFRSIALQKNNINAEVLLPLLCIGSALAIPFIAIANLLMTRYH